MNILHIYVIVYENSHKSAMLQVSITIRKGASTAYKTEAFHSAGRDNKVWLAFSAGHETASNIRSFALALNLSDKSLTHCFVVDSILWGHAYAWAYGLYNYYRMLETNKNTHALYTVWIQRKSSWTILDV